MKFLKYKILFLFVVFIIYSKTEYHINYAKGISKYYEYISNSGSVTEYREYVNLSDLIFSIVDSEVIFTQDSEYYYFDITQSFIGRDEGYGFCLYHKYYNTPGYVIAPFTNIDKILFYNYMRFTSTSNTVEYYLNLDGKTISEYEQVVTSSANNIKKNSYSYNFICSMYGGPKGDTKGFKFINSSNAFRSVGDFTSNLKFGIKKDTIDNFRYFRFYFPFYWDRNTSTSGSQYLYSSGVSNYSIDLKDYINCSHNYIYEENNMDEHKKICENCKWEIVEEHNFNLPYDNIEENSCICGCNKIVRFILLNMNDKVIFEFSGRPNDSINYVDDKNKLGADFLYYETYSLYGSEWVKEIDSDEIIDTLKSRTIKYIKIEKIHKYNLLFNKENSIDLSLNGNMDKQIIYCGERVKINKCEFFIKGYSFMGWGIKPNISEVLFLDEELVIDLSYEDDKNINLYPVFSPLGFDVRYHYKVNDLVKTVSYTYDKIENLEKFDLYLDNDRSFVGWEYDGEILKNENTKALNIYVEDNIRSFDLYAYIKTPLNGSERTSNTENSPDEKNFLSDKETINDKENNINKSNENIVVNEKIDSQLDAIADLSISISENIENFIKKIFNVNELLDYELFNRNIKEQNENIAKKSLNNKKQNNLFLNIVEIVEKFKNVDIIVLLQIAFYTICFVGLNLIVFFILFLIKKIFEGKKL